MTIGQVTKAHGFRGEFKVFPLTDDIRRFRKLKYVIIEGKEYNVSFVKLQSDRAILKLDGIDSEEEVNRIKSLYIQVRKEDAVKKRRDEYFIEELKGMKVFDTDETYLGIIFDVIQTGSNDAYWIKEPKQLLIPALKTVVKDINLEENKITIVPPSVWNYEDEKEKNSDGKIDDEN